MTLCFNPHTHIKFACTKHISLPLPSHHLNIIINSIKTLNSWSSSSSRIFSPPSLAFLPSTFFPPFLCCCCSVREREREWSHIRLYTVAWRHAFWFIDLKWPPCCDCCRGLDGERGSCAGVSGRGCMFAQNSRPFLGHCVLLTWSVLRPGGFATTVVMMTD